VASTALGRGDLGLVPFLQKLEIDKDMIGRNDVRDFENGKRNFERIRRVLLSCW
jgi:hypothetical protein